MKRFSILISCLIIALAFTACNFPAANANIENNGDIGDSGASNAANPTLAVPTVTLAIFPSPTTTIYGQVSGQICYPNPPSPEMVVYLENINTHVVYEVEIDSNQSNYQSELPPGGYMAFAWLPDYSRGGTYSQAVLCGLGATCTDHTLTTFFITSGHESTDIDICDWPDSIESVPTPSNKG